MDAHGNIPRASSKTGQNYFDKDMIHLNERGTSLLASNLRHKIEVAVGMKRRYGEMNLNQSIGSGNPHETTGADSSTSADKIGKIPTMIPDVADIQAQITDLENGGMLMMTAGITHTKRATGTSLIHMGTLRIIQHKRKHAQGSIPQQQKYFQELPEEHERRINENSS